MKKSPCFYFQNFAVGSGSHELSWADSTYKQFFGYPNKIATVLYSSYIIHGLSNNYV